MKIFAPFETELGTWSNVQGAYVLRATAPPVTIKPGRREGWDTSGIPLGYLWLMYIDVGGDMWGLMYEIYLTWGNSFKFNMPVGKIW